MNINKNHNLLLEVINIILWFEFLIAETILDAIMPAPPNCGGNSLVISIMFFLFIFLIVNLFIHF